MDTIFNKLFAGQQLSLEESQTLFSAIIRGELTESQLAAVLISMKMRGEHPQEIAGAARFAILWVLAAMEPIASIFQQPVRLSRQKLV